MDQPRAFVIGGGIGGLTAAVALHQRGWAVTVLERAPELTPAGAGLGLAPNSQRALDVIGLGDQVRALSAWQGDGGLRAPVVAGSPVRAARPDSPPTPLTGCRAPSPSSAGPPGRAG